MTGASYVLVDFPRPAQKAGTRGGGRRDWGLRGRTWWIMPPEDLINWSLRRAGEFRVGGAADEADQEGPGGRSGVADGDTVGVLRQADVSDLRAGSRADGAGAVSWWMKGRMALAKLERVPLFELRIPEGLWMLNRAGLLQLEHFNKSNALAWALTMGLVRDAGGLFRSRMEPDGGRELLHPVGAGGQVRVDGAGGQSLSDRGGQSDAACRRRFTGSVTWRRREDRSTQAGCNRGSASSWIFRSRRKCCEAYGDAVKDQIRRVLKAIEGGAGGRDGDQRDGDGRVRHRGLRDGIERCEGAAWRWGSSRRR